MKANNQKKNQHLDCHRLKNERTKSSTQDRNELASPKKTSVKTKSPSKSAKPAKTMNSKKVTKVSKPSSKTASKVSKSKETKAKVNKSKSPNSSKTSKAPKASPKIFIDVDFVPTDDKYTPQYKTEEAACCDLVACIPVDPLSNQRKVSINYRTTVLLGTGVKAAIPDGWKICIAARSSYAKRGLVCTNSPAQIDSDYRDEIKVITCNIGREIIEINDGDRFAQCWIEPVQRIRWNKKEELKPANSSRTGGFGSTGVTG